MKKFFCITSILFLCLCFAWQVNATLSKNNSPEIIVYNSVNKIYHSKDGLRFTDKSLDDKFRTIQYINSNEASLLSKKSQLTN